MGKRIISNEHKISCLTKGEERLRHAKKKNTPGGGAVSKGITRRQRKGDGKKKTSSTKKKHHDQAKIMFTRKGNGKEKL